MTPQLRLVSVGPRFAAMFQAGFLITMFTVSASIQILASPTPLTGENAYCGKGDVPRFGDKDGPAELPRTCYYTGLDGTPSPGRQIRVPAKADLASAIEGAKCGDVLLLPAGASFAVRELPSKHCDSQHYLTVRTETPDSKLPPEGTRISPAWAGVASLPGRPAYTQPEGGAAKLMATVVSSRPDGLRLGDHIRFIGIEWVSDREANVGRLLNLEGSDHVILDRNWIHPAEGAEVGKGVSLMEGARVIAVINSYISGFNCVARSGKCTDASAVGGGHGNEPTGTFKIVNNFLEASGENILFGGSGATVNPVDIEIRRNHFYKPIIWREGEPGYTTAPSGDPYIAKNHFELKNAQRVLFEANLLENSWGGFTQSGFSIGLNPRNQANHCPKCQVTDITIRYVRIRNVGGVISIANGLSKTGGESSGGGRYSIHDLIVDSVHQRDFKGHGVFATMLSNRPPLHDVWFDHITAVVPGPILTLKAIDHKIDNFRLTNSVLAMGSERPPVASAGGGPQNCAARTQKAGPEAVLQACFSNYKFEKNLVISDRGPWPSGTIVASDKSAGIRDLRDGVSRDPRLCRKQAAGCTRVSPGAGAATDGSDLGANVDAVEAALSGVE